MDKFEITENYLITKKVPIKNNDIIIEDIYLNDIFNDLIQYIINNYQNLISEYFILDTVKIKELLPKNFLGKRFFKQNKEIYILITNFIQYDFKSFNFSKFDKERVQHNLLISNSFLISDLDCLIKNQAILFLDEKIFQYTYNEFSKNLIHELIHIFQWITGRSIYDVLKNKEIEISDQDILEINQCFNTRKKFDLNLIFNKLFSDYEIADYCQQIAYDLKQFLNRNELRVFFQNLIKLNLTFKQRFDLINQYSWFKTLKINYQLFLLLSAHYRLGINTIKNHIYGYFNK